MELFKSGERLKSCRIKLPLKGSLASWKNLMKLNTEKHRALHLGLSIPTHLCSLAADEPWDCLERLEYVPEILAGPDPEQTRLQSGIKVEVAFESGAG